MVRAVPWLTWTSCLHSPAWTEAPTTSQPRRSLTRSRRRNALSSTSPPAVHSGSCSQDLPADTLPGWGGVRSQVHSCDPPACPRAPPPARPLACPSACQPARPPACPRARPPGRPLARPPARSVAQSGGGCLGAVVARAMCLLKCNVPGYISGSTPP